MENALVALGAIFALAMMLIVTSDWVEPPPNAMELIEAN